LWSLHVAGPDRRGRHVILYRLTGQRTIDILRILHHSMDLGRHIAEDLETGQS
jgi:plasmid stabilization system protein ParE